MLHDQLAGVRRRIQQACQRCARDPQSVRLIGVTKGVSLEIIREAVSLGLTELGENRVQETRQKQMALGSEFWARWHLIGHLQRNKAKDAVELFDVIHSVDSLAVAEAIERHAAIRSRRIDVLIQVNVSEEVTKFGCKPDDAPALAKAIGQLPQLALTGLMTLAPFSDDPEQARPHFRRLRELRDELQQQLIDAPLFLSMGMSQDFEVAIEEGADLVRVGTAIFGARG